MKELSYRPDSWDYALLFGGIIGVFLGLTAALGLGGVALTGFIGGNRETALAGEWSAAATLAMAALCLPAVYYGGGKVLGFPVGGKEKPSRRWLLLILLFPATLATGYLAYERGIVAGLLGPISHLTAAGLPVLAAVVLLRSLGPAIPQRRAWGQFLAGLWLTPAGALTLELITLIPTAAILLIGLNSSIDVTALGEMIISPDPLGSREFESVVRQLILQPWVIVIILVYVAIMVPIVEETLKSIAVWPFLRRGLTPAEAFLSGTLAGAGYAMFEALFLTQPGQGWVETMLARVGATFVHVFTAGLSSWGLVEGFRYRRWSKCVLAALAAFAIHGAWNASAVGIGLAVVAEQVGIPEAATGAWPTIAGLGALVLATLGVVSFVGPIFVTRRLTEARAGAVPDALELNPPALPRVPS